MKFLIGYLVGSFSASFVYFIFLKITYGICKSSTEEIAELEKQVEKMKSCHNCKNARFSKADNFCEQLVNGQCEDFSDWKLKEETANE